MAANDIAAHDIPLSLILGRSVSEGFIKRNDPELKTFADKVVHNEGHKTITTNGHQSTQRVPLSQSTAIYNHKIGLASTTTHSRHPKRASTLNVLNSRRAPQTAATTTTTTTTTNGGVGANTRQAARGYGLPDFSSDESDFNSEDSDLSDNEQDHTQPHRNGASQYIPPANNPAHYVAHITGRMDPWEAQMQQIQDLGKVDTGFFDDIAPEIADKIAKGFNESAQKSNNFTVQWIKEDDIVQKLKGISLEAESIKEKRRKESESRNQSMSKDIDACIAQVKEERDTAIRNLQEAARKVQEEKDRVAKEAEDKRKADLAKKEELEKKRAEAAAVAAEKAKKAAEEAASLASAKSTSLFASDSARQEWEGYSKVLEHIKTVVAPSITSNPGLKKNCNAVRRDIVAAIGRVTNRREEIMRVATELDGIFRTTMQAGENVYYWAMNVTAKKLVKQSETEALVKSAPTFPVAHVAVLLFTTHAKFLDVLMARFAKKCPYVTPMYIPKANGDSAEQFLTKLGYKKKESGFESEAQYDSRQAAIFTLYCAILQTKPPVGTNVHGIDNGWRWMARILNMPPRPITPALIQVFLEVCGNEFMRTYRNQATKTLQLLMHKFIPLIPPTGVAGTVRLKTLLEAFLKTGNIPVADGQQYDP
ncbi:Nuclear pore complex nucleoporin component [Linnemannia gamsii]|uniref:mRNA export factor GLE1 n=1 Tax=Linnemannia gamsii TaxID=64522 RepID=A0ABQ7KFK1_9FUNG|nr:Nuclear pore complex nucleoporin component [Linnemannia gamsii]